MASWAQRRGRRKRSGGGGTREPLTAAAFLKLNNFIFHWISHLQKSCKNSRIPFIQIPQILMFSHICLSFYFFLNRLTVKCRRDAPLPLNISVCFLKARTFSHGSRALLSRSGNKHCYYVVI